MFLVLRKVRTMWWIRMDRCDLLCVWFNLYLLQRMVFTVLVRGAVMVGWKMLSNPPELYSLHHLCSRGAGGFILKHPCMYLLLPHGFKYYVFLPRLRPGYILFDKMTLIILAVYQPSNKLVIPELLATTMSCRGSNVLAELQDRYFVPRQDH